jgi:thiamine-phosphate pyrophosphorylase
MRLPDPPLLLVTDRTQARMPLEDVVGAACAGGCRWVSVREKDLPAGAQIALAASLRPTVLRFGARLSLHGDAAVARAAGLDGVHLAAQGDPAAARAILGPRALIGLSAHSVAEAATLDPALLDYAIAGPAFATASKPGYGPALGPEGLAAICRATAVPVLAIGGIAADNVAAVIAAGVAGIAVMGSVMRAAAPRMAIEELLAALLAAAREPRRA